MLTLPEEKAEGHTETLFSQRKVPGVFFLFFLFCNLFKNHQFTMKLLLFSHKNRRWANHDYFGNEIFSCCLVVPSWWCSTAEFFSFFSSARAHLHTAHSETTPEANFQVSIYYIIYSQWIQANKNSHQQFNSSEAFSTHTHTSMVVTKKKENWWWHPNHLNTVEEPKSIGYLVNVASQKDLLHSNANCKKISQGLRSKCAW